MARDILKSIRHRLARYRMREFAGVSIENAFDRIYERGIWSNRGNELSGGGSYGRVADEHFEYLSEFVKAQRVESILDIGCGDFNIGSRIAPLVARYTAIDVSARIIEFNKKRFASFKNVEFRHADACTAPLVKADLVTVRQVFQHLTNAQITMILENIERSGIESALVTEHSACQAEDFEPNLDLPNHSSLTRSAIGSGVALDAAPFCRNASLVRSISLSDLGDAPAGEVLNIYWFKPRAI